MPGEKAQVHKEVRFLAQVEEISTPIDTVASFSSIPKDGHMSEHEDVERAYEPIACLIRKIQRLPPCVSNKFCSLLMRKTGLILCDAFLSRGKALVVEDICVRLDSLQRSPVLVADFHAKPASERHVDQFAELFKTGSRSAPKQRFGNMPGEKAQVLNQLG